MPQNYVSFCTTAWCARLVQCTVAAALNSNSTTMAGSAKLVVLGLAAYGLWNALNDVLPTPLRFGSVQAWLTESLLLVVKSNPQLADVSARAVGFTLAVIYALYWILTAEVG